MNPHNPNNRLQFNHEDMIHEVRESSIFQLKCAIVFNGVFHTRGKKHFTNGCRITTDGVRMFITEKGFLEIAEGHNVCPESEKMIQGEYPNWESVLPDSCKDHFTLTIPDWIADSPEPGTGVERGYFTRLFSGDWSAPQAEYYLAPRKPFGYTFCFAVNSYFFRPFIGWEVQIGYNGGMDPLVIQGKDLDGYRWLYLVSPLQLGPAEGVPRR